MMGYNAAQAEHERLERESQVDLLRNYFSSKLQEDDATALADHFVSRPLHDDLRPSYDCALAATESRPYAETKVFSSTERTIGRVTADTPVVCRLERTETGRTNRHISTWQYMVSFSRERGSLRNLHDPIRGFMIIGSADLRVRRFIKGRDIWINYNRFEGGIRLSESDRIRLNEYPRLKKYFPDVVEFPEFTTLGIPAEGELSEEHIARLDGYVDQIGEAFEPVSRN